VLVGAGWAVPGRLTLEGLGSALASVALAAKKRGLKTLGARGRLILQRILTRHWRTLWTWYTRNATFRRNVSLPSSREKKGRMVKCAGRGRGSQGVP
jgi:hypothetical protein